MLRFMYITNSPEIVRIAAEAGVERLFVDLETLGKAERQGGMDTVQSQHSIADISRVKEALPVGCELLVRSNPLHRGSKGEIDAIVEAGADIVMLPYFRTAAEAEEFVRLIAGRTRTCLLLENRESAVDNLDAILAVDGVDEYYVGLNDLHLSLGEKFMFEPLADGLLDRICAKIRATGKPFGFGGIARLGGGALPAERVIAEHHRLGSTRAIVSRSFCNTALMRDRREIARIFREGIDEIRRLERRIEAGEVDLAENRAATVELIRRIVHG